jgi:DNA-binding MarR family transcriptional regulator
MDVKRAPKASSRATAPGGIEHTLYEFIRRVRPLHRYVAKTVEDHLEGTGVTVGMRAVLERLHEGGPQSVPQISRSLLLNRQFIQRLVNASLEAELVKGVPNPAHRRSALLELTPKGQATFKRIKDQEEKLLRELAAELHSKDIEAALRVMSHVTERFREIARDPQE